LILREDERSELEGLARSTKTEYRLRQRARIVLLAADGVASRAVGRMVGCTTGTASKWQVRYARDRLAGLDETGERGADPKYTAETERRILAVLDRPVPAGHRRWTGPLIAAELGDVDVQSASVGAKRGPSITWEFGRPKARSSGQSRTRFASFIAVEAGLVQKSSHPAYSPEAL
jgi:transposase